MFSASSVTPVQEIVGAGSPEIVTPKTAAPFETEMVSPKVAAPALSLVLAASAVVPVMPRTL